MMPVGSYRTHSGLPGTYKLGGYYDAQELEDVESERDVSGTWGPAVSHRSGS